MPGKNELRYGALAGLLARTAAPRPSNTLRDIEALLGLAAAPTSGGVTGAFTRAGIATAATSGLAGGSEPSYGISLPRADPAPRRSVLGYGQLTGLPKRNAGVAAIPRASVNAGIAMLGGGTTLSRISTGLSDTGRSALRRPVAHGLNIPADHLATRIARQAAPFLRADPSNDPRMLVQIFDVEHGSCAVIGSPDRRRMAMLDAGHNSDSKWTPSKFFTDGLERKHLDYLFTLNFDQDHIGDMVGVTNNLSVGVLVRNPSATPSQLRRIKEESGSLTNAAERYLSVIDTYTAPVQVPFNAGMAGVTCTTFYNPYPRFSDTNNLSLVVFVNYGDFKILFPGDLERAGWLALLKDPAFCAELVGTCVLVASHHGRENGYCKEIFQYFTPYAVIMSDKEVVHETQEMTKVYHGHCRPEGIPVGAANVRRRVLTTRKDGDILLRVAPTGFYTKTELNP